MAKKSKVLILSASFGQGHEAVGRAIKTALELRYRNEIKIIFTDLAKELRRHTNSLFTKTYERTTRYTPSVYGLFYKATDNPYSQDFIRRLTIGFNYRRLKKYLHKQRPDVIVSVFPVWSHLVKSVIKPSEKWYEFINVLTDCQEVHSAWTGDWIDHYIVADKNTSQIVTKLGVDKTKIHTLGYPVNPALEKVDSQAKVRAKLNLPINQDVILYVASGDHFLFAGQIIRQLRSIDCRLVVICGRNKRLYRPLGWLFARDRDIAIVGWTNQMADYIVAADVVVTKAGGSTVMECLALRRPIIINRVVPGQEEGNAKLIAQNKLGFIELKPRKITQKTNLILKNKAKFAKRLDSYGADPKAAQNVADFIVGLCHRS